MMESRLPKVVVYQVATADARVALSPDRLLMHDPRWPRYADGGYHEVMTRHRPQVILEGSGTMVLPDAGPLERLPDATAVVPDGHPGSQPTSAPTADPAIVPPVEHFLPADVRAKTTCWFAVVDSRGRVEWPFTTPLPDQPWIHLLVLVSRATPATYLAYLRSQSIPYLVAGDTRVDLTGACALMRDQLGAETVVATCGAILSGVLLRSGLIDEYDVEILPLLAGGRTTPVSFTAPDLAPDDPPTNLRLIECRPLNGGRVLLRYVVERPDAD